jgi:hypothetical protein
MQNERNTGKDWLNYFLLGLFIYLAYLPLSSFLFALKNDALTQNFPHKYFFSAALHAGYWPLWNPYVNFGLPLYADPGFAYWQPLTWLFGMIGYNVYILAVETLTYIWLGGIFMYRLGMFLGHARRTAFLLGICYMCCGFFIGNLQHTNFLTCAAFLPLVTRSFLQLQEAFSPKKLFFAALGIYLLGVGGHPAIPFATVYFLTAILAGLALTRKGGSRRKALVSAVSTNSLLLLAVLGLLAPVLLSWSEIWPWFNRSAPVFQPGQQGLGFTPASYVSFLFPFVTTAQTEVFGTDLSMRNGYFSFIGLALFLTALLSKKNRYQTVFLFVGAGMLLLSLGGVAKAFIYSHLPLLQFIRSNGEYRVFALLSFMIVLSWPLDNLLKEKTPTPLFTKVMAGFAILSTLVALIAIIYLHPVQPRPTASGFTGRVKGVLDTLPLAERLLINSITLLALLATWFLFRKKIPPRRLVPALMMTDLLLFCWMHLPVTGVQRMSPSEIEAVFSSAPPGIPLPRLLPLSANDRPGEGLVEEFGCWSYYNKQPGTPELCDYPTVLRSTERYFQSPWPDSINKRPFIFLMRSKANLRLCVFSPTEITVEAASPISDTLVLLQNDFPGWETMMDGHPCPHTRQYLSFMGIATPEGGSHCFVFRFSDHRLIWYICIFLATAAILAGWALYLSRFNKS